MSGQISSPTNVIKSPTPSAVYHRVVTEEELIRSMTATVKKPMVTAENKIYGTTSVGPRFKKKAPIVAKMVTMHSGYKTYPAFEPVALPKSKQHAVYALACCARWPREHVGARHRRAFRMSDVLACRSTRCLQLTNRVL